MAITFATEKIASFYEEAKDLIDAQHEEISLHVTNGFPGKTREIIYNALDDAGYLLLLVARDAGEIVGYYISIQDWGLNYATCFTSGSSIFYVKPEYRSKGVAKDMFMAVEKELRARGVKLWQMGCKAGHPTTKLFESVGAEPAELTYYKWLKDENE